jgi:hypothetical protein
MRLISILSSILIIAACASNPTSSYQPTRQDISFPAIGEITRVSLGEDMMMQGYRTTSAGIILRNRVPFGMFASYWADPGEYKLTGSTEDETFYLPTDGQNSGRITLGALTDPFKHLMINRSGKLCAVTVYNSAICTSDADFEKGEVGGLSLDSFQQTLIYSGRVGDKIRLTYREFSGGRIRDAFSNDIEYDLSQSRFIGYKGAEIEVIEATNNFIEFRLIENF